MKNNITENLTTELSNFPDDFSYDHSLATIKNIIPNLEITKNFIEYIYLQKQNAEKKAKWYFIINLSGADPNVKIYLIQKI